jgi:transposase-like protein
VPRTRPPYPPEFRAEAVRLIRSGGKLIREVADDLGVSEQTRGTGSASPISTTAAATTG